jgi:hypothetical protein
MGGLLDQAKKLQDELRRETVEFSAGGGMVTARMNGHLELLALTIKKEIIDPADPELLQDVVAAAVNGALKKAQDLAREKLSATLGFDPGSLLG